MNLGNLLKIDYWFNVRTLAFKPATFKALVVALVVILVLAVILSLRQRKLEDKLKQKTARKLSTFFYSLSLVGMTLVFFRQQELPYLAMRLWLFAWFLACLIWFIFILRYIFIKVPKILQERRKRLEMEKYLPK